MKLQEPLLPQSTTAKQGALPYLPSVLWMVKTEIFPLFSLQSPSFLFIAKHYTCSFHYYALTCCHFILLTRLIPRPSVTLLSFKLSESVSIEDIPLSCLSTYISDYVFSRFFVISNSFFFSLNLSMPQTNFSAFSVLILCRSSQGRTAVRLGSHLSVCFPRTSTSLFDQD